VYIRHHAKALRGGLYDNDPRYPNERAMSRMIVFVIVISCVSMAECLYCI
jgi:hypothetical protein